VAEMAPAPKQKMLALYDFLISKLNVTFEILFLKLFFFLILLQFKKLLWLK